MGRKIVLSGTTLTNTNAPRLANVDPIETDGSIFLFDLAHPASSYPLSAVPAEAEGVENLLAALGSATIGAPATASYSRAAGYNGTKGVLERTSKGGLHGIVSPTLADGTVNLRVMMGTAIRQHFITNPTHLFYLSVWGYITKSATPVTSSVPGIRAVIAANSSPAANNMAVLANGRGTRSSSATGPAFYNVAPSGWTGTAPTSEASFSIRLPALPVESTWNYTTEMQRAQGGFIAYRAYLEDLTASGRTYADVDALDYGLYTKEVMTPGGRYYGDTFTDPATIP
jgi:hypothetical protein